MRREQILKTLEDHRQELNDEFGVTSMRLFGSVARGEADADSESTSSSISPRLRHSSGF